MRVLLATLVLALLALAPAVRAGRVVLIGVDGGSWNVIDPMLAEGALPHLASLIARGSTARFSTVEPVSSPVVWTSLATGRRPESHGITDFFGTRLSIRDPSVFERLAADGVRVGLYDYLVTWPPASLPGGFVIPGWLRRDASVTPADVWTRIGLAPYANDYKTARSTADYLSRAREDVSLKAVRWNALAKTFDVQVGAVTFYSVDMTSHRFWHAAYPEEFADGAGPVGAAESSAIRDAVLGVDRSIGQILRTLSEEDTVLVVSDHGFHGDPEGGRDVWLSLLDETLAREGLDPKRDGFSVVGTFAAVTLRVHPGDDVRERDALVERLVTLLESFRDADGRRAYGTVEFVDVAPRPPGHARPWTSRIWQWGVRMAVRFAFNVEIDDGSHAVVFGLPDGDVLRPLWPDGVLRVGEHEVPVRNVVSLERFTGTHDPTGIFVAAGGPVAQRAERGDVSVLDVAPLLFYLADRPIPDDLEGQLPVEILDAEHLRKHPAARIEAAKAPRLGAPDRPAVSIDDPTLTERLRALGYIE